MRTLFRRDLAQACFLIAWGIFFVGPDPFDRAEAAVTEPAVMGNITSVPVNVATSEGDAPDPDAQLSPVDYLAAADRLILRFRGYPELTGEYRISPERVISVPVVGRVSIAGLDLASLEKTLSIKLSQIVGKESFATAEVAAYRSVYVTGAVRNPGAIEWRPNLTVLQAIALVGGMAGGIGPGASPGNGLNPLALEKAVDGQKRDLAIIARLQTELKGAQRIATPPPLVNLVGLSEADRLIAREAEVLANDRDSVSTKLSTLQHGIEAGNQELTSLRQQSDKLNAQLQMRAEYSNQIKGLFSRGIVTAERNLEEGIKITDLEEKITNIKVGVAKTVGTVAQLQLAAVALKRDRETAIHNELEKVERESAQLSIEIRAEQRIPEQLPQSEKDAAGHQIKSALQIVRQRHGNSSTIAADQGTIMHPGDVLIVGRY